MGSHILKTTIEIADDLFARAQEKARRDRRLPPLVTVRGKGRVSEFKQAGWDRIRDEIYRERGA